MLRILGERPGVGASELSVASGVARPVLYQLLAKLVEQGEVVKERLPGVGTGYSLHGHAVASERGEGFRDSVGGAVDRGRQRPHLAVGLTESGGDRVRGRARSRRGSRGEEGGRATSARLRMRTSVADGSTLVSRPRTA